MGKSLATDISMERLFALGCGRLDIDAWSFVVPPFELTPGNSLALQRLLSLLTKDVVDCVR